MTEILVPFADRWTVRWTSFNSREVCRAVGLPPDLLSQWTDDFSFLRDPHGQSYDTRALAAVMLRFDLERWGIPPQEIAIIAKQAANMLVWYALLSREGVCAVRGTRPEQRWFFRAFRENAFLADKIAGISTPPRYLLRRKENDLEFVYDLGSDQREARTSAYVDLMLSACDLVTSARRPLCVVEFGKKLEGPCVCEVARD